jgi:acetylornithine/succinyldiaminopimelate/putrescine aminotransferase
LAFVLRELFIVLFVIIPSTFGGNPLASAVAIASLDVIKEEGLAERYHLLSTLN